MHLFFFNQLFSNQRCGSNAKRALKDTLLQFMDSNVKRGFSAIFLVKQITPHGIVSIMIMIQILLVLLITLQLKLITLNYLQCHLWTLPFIHLDNSLNILWCQLWTLPFIHLSKSHLGLLILVPHMIVDLSNLPFSTPYPTTNIIQTANGEGLPVSHAGNSIISTPGKPIKLN